MALRLIYENFLFISDMRGFLDSFRELMKPFQRPIPTISFPENALLDTYIQTHDYNITHSNEYDEAQRLVEEREKQGDLYLYLPPNLLKSVILRPTNAPAKGSQEQPGWTIERWPIEDDS